MEQYSTALVLVCGSEKELTELYTPTASLCPQRTFQTARRVLSVTETLHNLPKLPYPVRAVAATAVTTAALAVANF